MSRDLEIIIKIEKELGIKLESETDLNEDEILKGVFEQGADGRVVKLGLDQMGLKEIPKAVFELKHLSSLSFHDNQLISLPAEIGQLTKLVNLTIGPNQLTNYPKVIVQLANLTKLELYSNQLTGLPSEICRHTKLTELNLHSNQLTSLPKEIGQLSKLTKLIVDDNKLTSLPKEIGQLTNLTELTVYGNPLETPPLEIAKKGIQAIHQYFESLEGQQQTLNEAKIILVGDGGAGKTSLVRRILGQKFRKNESQTHGININEWQVKDRAESIKVRLWDFGGQEIMHATHQFFLSKRSLYILVLDAREEKKAEYWLKYIESFGGNSSILIVINKIDENPSFEENRKFLTAKYEGIKGFHKVSCASGDAINEFKEHLCEEIKQVELRQSVWAESWLEIKKQLETTTENYISYQGYEKLCDGKQIETEQRTILIEFLHDLGVILHFKNLADKNVLNPKWVTEAVYKIINSKKTAGKYGIIDQDNIDDILNKEKFTDKHMKLSLGKINYALDERNYIVDLMKEFELSYSLSQDQILIPDLLNVEEPDFKFDYENCIRFQFDYDFLPRSIMPRFIVKMHKDTDGDQLWRTGILLKNKIFKARALVIADDHARKINLYVNGSQKRHYFATILYAFREINHSFEKLSVIENVPMPDDPETTVSYAHLLVLSSLKKDDFVPDGSSKEYSVAELLGEIQITKPTESEAIEILTEIRDKLKSDDEPALRKTLDIKPNFFGMGVDLNPWLNKLFAKKKTK